MNKLKSIIKRILAIARREHKMFYKRPMFLFCMLIAPVFAVIFFTSLMDAGLPTKIPTGLVDEDNTQISRTIVRTLDAFEMTNIVAHYPNFTEARKAMQRGDIYAFFYIPDRTTDDALASRQPKISFYTNETYFVPGTLLMKDLRYACELTGLALTRENLYAHGLTEKQAMAVIQPVVIETHPIGNSYLNYSVYLNNIVIPGILILVIMLSTTYVIGIEWKHSSQKSLYRLSGNNSVIALIGKLLPQLVIFTLMFIFMDVYLYKFMGFPCQCGLLPMMLIGFLTVLASQCFAIFLFGIFSGQMRLTMCLCSLWGILSFSLCGFTYPVTAMSSVLENMAALFPLRHYYLIYVNQALNGYSITYVWSSVVGLIAFTLLPLLVIKRYRAAFLKLKYKA